MAKKLEISRKNYNTIKDIIKVSSCMAVAYTKVQEEFNINRDQAYKIVNAVYYDYKYLKIIE
jgi:hypothetical protein